MTPLYIRFAVAPGFGDSVKELRSVHSSLLTELQHSFCEVANDNLNLTNELNSLQNAASVMQTDVVSLQDVVQTLNAVSLCCVVV